MKNYRIAVAALTTLAACNIVACKKKTTEPTGCSASIISAYTPVGKSAGHFDTLAIGTFDDASITLNQFNSITYYQNSGQPVYNPTDNSYYAFRGVGMSFSNAFLKISMDGTVTTFTDTASAFVQGLVYNKTTNKMYCIYYSALKPESTPCQIVEVSTSGNAVVTTPVVAIKGKQMGTMAATASIDQSTGVIYFATKSERTVEYTVEKYVPGATTTTVIMSGNDRTILGLRYNPNDHMLYAISEEYPQPSSGAEYHFVRIDPNNGALTKLSKLPFSINNRYYSTIITPCTNRYLLSAVTGAANDVNIVAQFDMNGSIVQQNTTAGIYHGLVVKE